MKVDPVQTVTIEPGKPTSIELGFALVVRPIPRPIPKQGLDDNFIAPGGGAKKKP
jgi:hypothetical protein